MSRPWLERSPEKWRSFLGFFCAPHWYKRCPVSRACLGAGGLCKCNLACGCSPPRWDAAAPHTGTLQRSGWEPRRAFAAGAQGSQAGAEPLDPSVPPARGSIPSRLSGVTGDPAGSFPSLPLGFRCTNPRGRTLPLQPVRGTSPPHPLRWAPPAVRTPLKRRRPPFRVTPATTLDCPPILMSGMCEGSCCPARDWTKCVGNKERKKKKKDKPSQLQLAPTEMEFPHRRPHRATPS